MKPNPPYRLPERLPPETALELYHFFSEMVDFVWDKYQTELVEYIIREEFNEPPPAQTEIEFFDDIEF